LRVACLQERAESGNTIELQQTGLRTRVVAAVAAALVAACAAPSGPAELRPPAPLRLNGTAATDCVPSWHARALPGKRPTRYAVSFDGHEAAIEAQADASASMLRHALRREPEALGKLGFSWRVPALMEAADVRDRDREDAVVRVLLAFEGSEGRLSPANRLLFDLAEGVTGERPPYATLMYVWDRHAPAESVVVNARTDRIRQIVVESGPAGLASWRHYERDIAADFRRAYGEAPGPLVGVGLMTDADNTGARARALYGPVCLSPRS
jgi:hypothetical protein